MRPSRLGAGGLEAVGHVSPVGDVPEGFDVVGLHVLVLQVEGVLPHVQHQQRDLARGEVALVVVQLLDDQLLAERVVGEDRPAGALDPERAGGEVLAERVERAEELVHRDAEVTVRLVAAVRGEVLPEDRVVHVTGQVEREVLAQLVHGAEGVLHPGFRELLQRGVGTGHVGLVVLGVVEFHDLAGDVRLECAVVIAKIRQGVVSHDVPPKKGESRFSSRLYSSASEPFRSPGKRPSDGRH